MIYKFLSVVRNRSLTKDLLKKICFLDKEEKKDRKLTVGVEKDRGKEHNKSDQEGDKSKRVFLSREKDKYHRSNSDVIKKSYFKSRN